MKKIIVTTTINPPTLEIRKYDAMEDWRLIVVGDRKTPEYKLVRGRYVSWEEQEANYPELCRLVGPDNTQRGRMIAFLEAYREGADIVATIDDDCDPYPNWGMSLHLGEPTEAVRSVGLIRLCEDPLHFLGYGDRWSRGFPLQLGKSERNYGKHHCIVSPLIQVDMSDGQGDEDAVVRIGGKQINFAFPKRNFFGGIPLTLCARFSPVNTQNTFIHGSVLKDHCGEIPFVGHVSDIWAGYLFQAYHPQSTIYCPATVYHYQDRTLESLLKDLKEEIFSYEHTLEFLEGLRDHGPDGLDKIACFPKKAIEAINLYRSYFK